MGHSQLGLPGFGAGVRAPPPFLSRFVDLGYKPFKFACGFLNVPDSTCLHDPTHHNPPPEKSPSLAVSLRTFKFPNLFSQKCFLQSWCLRTPPSWLQTCEWQSCKWRREFARHLGVITSFNSSCLCGCIVLNRELLQGQDCVLITPSQLSGAPGSFTGASVACPMSRWVMSTQLYLLRLVPSGRFCRIALEQTLHDSLRGCFI